MNWLMNIKTKEVKLSFEWIEIFNKIEAEGGPVQQMDCVELDFKDRLVIRELKKRHKKIIKLHHQGAKFKSLVNHNEGSKADVEKTRKFGLALGINLHPHFIEYLLVSVCREDEQQTYADLEYIIRKTALKG